MTPLLLLLLLWPGNSGDRLVAPLNYRLLGVLLGISSPVQRWSMTLAHSGRWGRVNAEIGGASSILGALTWMIGCVVGVHHSSRFDVDELV